MAEVPDTMGHVGDLAQPLHIQRLNRSLNLQPFLNNIEQIFKRSQSDDANTNLNYELDLPSTSGQPGVKYVNGVPTTKEERRSDKMRLYNFSNVPPERKWLKDALISDTSDSSATETDEELSEEYFQQMLHEHVQEKKHRSKIYKHENLRQYQYFGTGILSNFDKYPEHRKKYIDLKQIENSKKPDNLNDSRLKKIKRKSKKEYNFNDSFDEVDHDDSLIIDDYDNDGDGDDRRTSIIGKHSRGRKRVDKNKSPEIMAMRRKKIYALMAKKEVPKGQRAKTLSHKDLVTAAKKVAGLCIKHCRQKALASQKNMKEIIWRMKRLTRENQANWKRYERVERDTRRRQEKEAEEQRKMDVELMEAKRQQRKLNFLITQTELYAHFISKKITPSLGNEQDKILSQLDEETNPRLASMDNYNSQQTKLLATKNVKEAINAEKARSSQFQHNITFNLSETNANESPQPAMFQGVLKHYQLKGMNWLSNLYDQGINGILADEMGLGKTVQSIAFLCHIAEKYNVWGPFLIISPASTLHNWQQEFQRFVPELKVVPYWGSVQERRILRQFWEQKDLHTKEASFHVVITSYQIVITDFKYFNRINWQYMILDEAQAIKSSNSMRWKLLLGFSCRNRLLLSGTPIQNSMAELWALLHFIMPTLFDNHEEFSEWFSKDIESQAENKSKIDEKHLSRLHMILKPFMLRRIKKDVENELSDKIEIMVYCPLTIRQKLLYSGLRQKIRIEDLLAGISGRGTSDDSTNKNVASSLMNLVMQFRKVCNHPELFERREPRSPLYFFCLDYVVPKLVFEEGIISNPFKLVYNMFSIHVVEWIRKSLASTDSIFNFLPFVNVSTMEFSNMILYGILYVWLQLSQTYRTMEQVYHQSVFRSSSSKQNRNIFIISPELPTCYPNVKTSPTINQLVFTDYIGKKSSVYTHTRHVYHSMPETLQHRVLRSQKVRAQKLEFDIDSSQAKPVEPQPPPKCGRPPTKTSCEDDINTYILPEFPYKERKPRIFENVPTHIPEFLYQPILKIQSRSRSLYSSCRNASWAKRRHENCANVEGWETVWYGSPQLAVLYRTSNLYFQPVPLGGLTAVQPKFGWSNIVIPDKQTLVADAGKLYVLDGLLKRLKGEGHRVLIYSQMTRMIDLLEEYMWHRKHTYMRLDGSSKISERRDMVADFQSRADIFVFLLSTRAGGLGINLTAADTVIFYDSDWNPTVDQQAMDRAHRLGQTKQVTVYRLICKGTIEERILQRAREKSEIQRMVISGGNFKPDHLKPKEVVSLLLDDEELEKKYQAKQAEKKIIEFDAVQKAEKKRKLKLESSSPMTFDLKRVKSELDDSFDSGPASPVQSDSVGQDDTSNDGLVVDIDTPSSSQLGSSFASNPFTPIAIGSLHTKTAQRGSRRGRPRGLRRGASNASRKKFVDEIKLPGEMFISGKSPSTSLDPKRGSVVKRGPGRPRMKPFIPGNRGTRGAPRGRRPSHLKNPIMKTPPAKAASHETSRNFGFYTTGSSGTD